MRAAGLRVPGRAGQHALRRVRQALQPGRGVRPGRAVRAQPLHPVHPLRALHGGRRRGAGAERVRAGRPGVHRHRGGAAARPSVGRQRGGSLPGGLAPVEGLPAQGAGVGPRQDGEHLSRLHPGLQHQHRHPRRRGGAVPSAPQPRRESALHVRHRAAGLPLAESGRPHRGAADARGRAHGRDRLGHRARPARRPAEEEHRLGGAARLGPAEHRVARPGAAAGGGPRCRRGDRRADG